MQIRFDSTESRTTDAVGTRAARALPVADAHPRSRARCNPALRGGRLVGGSVWEDLGYR
jgi:hypothetical protein